LADRLLTLCHALVRQRTVETLDKFIIMDDVTLDDATERFGAIAIEGPQAPALLHQICGIQLEAMAKHTHAQVTIDSLPCRMIRCSHTGEPGAEFIAARSQLSALWESLLAAVRARGGGPIGYAALNALRLEAGIPWFSYDFDDKIIPHEAALETTHVSYTKGCYTGQEIVERVRSRGQVNRRRVGLQFTGSAVPEPGTKLLADGKEVGHVTSAALSLALSRIIGMGYLRREHNSPGSRVQWAGGAAEVIELPVAGVQAARSAL
jgi:folate-binding protein YgfZ